MSDDITATHLERQGDAFIATFAAWLYPSDLELRRTAVEACGLVNVDYIETLVDIMGKAGPTASVHTVRYAVAMHFLDNVAAMRAVGVSPREGIAATGRPTDELGRDASVTDSGPPP